MHALVVGDRHVDEPRVGLLHRGAEAAGLGRVAAQQAVLDVVERPAQARDPRALAREKALDLDLERIAQHAGVVEIEPEGGLHSDAQPARIDLGDRSKAGGEAAVLARNDQRGKIAGARRSVEMRGLHRLERLRALLFPSHACLPPLATIPQARPCGISGTSTMWWSAPAAPAACWRTACPGIRTTACCSSKPAGATTGSGSTSRSAISTPSPTRAPTGATKPNPTSTSRAARSTTRAAVCSAAAHRSTP